MMIRMHKNNIFQKFKHDKEYQRYYKEAGDLLDIAIEIAEARKRRRLTQTQLAKKAGMPQSQVALIESGSHNVTIRNLTRIANALDLQIKAV